MQATRPHPAVPLGVSRNGHNGTRYGTVACSALPSSSLRPLFKTASQLSSLPMMPALRAAKSEGGRKEADVQGALEGLKRAIKMGGTIDPAYLNGSAYLQTVGFSNAAEIARILDVAMNPNSLFHSYNDVKRARNANARPLDVDKDMRPVLEFLASQGVGPGDIARIISAHPPVLSYSVEQRLQPFWQYLGEIGVPNVAAAIIARPSLLGLDVDRNLRKIVDYLLYVETPIETVVQYLQRSI